MKKYLVLSYYDGILGIDVIKDTYGEAKEWMDSDVRSFVSTFNLKESFEDLTEDQVYIGENFAYANPSRFDACDWKIEEIEV